MHFFWYQWSFKGMMPIEHTKVTSSLFETSAIALWHSNSSKYFSTRSRGLHFSLKHSNKKSIGLIFGHHSDTFPCCVDRTINTTHSLHGGSPSSNTGRPLLTHSGSMWISPKLSWTSVSTLSTTHSFSCITNIVHTAKSYKRCYNSHLFVYRTSGIKYTLHRRKAQSMP